MNSDFDGLEIRLCTPYINGIALPILKDWKDHGMRRKFLYKNYIIKIDDRGYCNYEQSTNELKRWNEEFQDEDKKYFQAPVAGEMAKDRNGSRVRGWIAQKFLDIKYTPYDDFVISTKRMKKISKILSELSKKYSLGDLHGNWVITETDRFKILDWGV